MADHTGPVLLSSRGSDRATAYNFSNKVLRHRGRLLVSWLEAPDTAQGPSRIWLGVCDTDSGQLQQTTTMGEGIDNHCGASLLTYANDRVHMFIGAHHGDFLHRWSDDPADQASWSVADPIGPTHSYPAVVMDARGTLHLLYLESYRGPGETWQLEYVRKPHEGAWSTPTVLAKCPVPGYSHFMHSLSLGPTGSLHVTLQFHYAASGSAKQNKTKMAAHLRSDDGGDHWTSEGQACELPVTIDNARTFANCIEDNDASIRIGTHVVDADDQPWVFCTMPESPYGVMWRRTTAGWQGIDLDAALPQLNFAAQGRSTATSRDVDDNVHLLISTQARGAGEGWYHPANELHHITFTPDGHWYIWTSGINAGWMDATDYEDTLKTQVWLGRR